MERKLIFLILLLALFSCNTEQKFKPATHVYIKGEKFYINGNPTFEGKVWNGIPVEGFVAQFKDGSGSF